MISFCGYNGINTAGSKELIARVSNILTYENINEKSQRDQDIIIKDKKAIHLDMWNGRVALSGRVGYRSHNF